MITANLFLFEVVQCTVKGNMESTGGLISGERGSQVRGLITGNREFNGNNIELVVIQSNKIEDFFPDVNFCFTQLSRS